jgi:hypothetical protein
LADGKSGGKTVFSFQFSNFQSEEDENPYKGGSEYSLQAAGLNAWQMKLEL